MAVKNQRMMRYFHPKLLLNRSLDFKQTRVTKLHDGLRLQVDEMVVLAEFVGALVLCAVVPKLVLDDKPTVQEEVDGVV